MYQITTAHTHVAANITDFDTEVGNHTDVAANTTHRGLTNDPHNVTATQVGLGNVDNTSDVNKPVSTATQTALDLKEDSLTFDLVPTNTSTNPVESNGVFDALAGKSDTGHGHTASDVSDFDTEVGNHSAVVANTAKVTNATHTGDVTGDVALTIANGAVDIAHHSATGTPDVTTYLRGDNTWATVAGGSSTQTFKKIVYIDPPTATDSFPILSVPFACTITRITHITDTGTVTWNLEERAEATPNTAGTDVYASDEVSSTTNSVDTSFANASLAAHSWLHLSASAIGSSPTKFWIAITFEEA